MTECDKQQVDLFDGNESRSGFGDIIWFDSEFQFEAKLIDYQIEIHVHVVLLYRKGSNQVINRSLIPCETLNFAIKGYCLRSSKFKMAH